MYHVVLSHKLKLDPLQTQLAKVQVDYELPQVLQMGRLIPRKELESQHCDLLNCLWEGDKEVGSSVTNCETESIIIPKGTAIGALEAVELITGQDPVWKESVDPIVVVVSDGRMQEQQAQTLGEAVSIGKDCSAKDKRALLEMILANHCTFAFSDEALGGTDLVEHDIKLPDSVPITKLDWTSECEEAFTKVKELLTSAPILHPLICQNHFFSVYRCL